MYCCHQSMIFLTVICSFKSCRSQQLQSLPTISESEVNQYLTSQSEDLLTKLVASAFYDSRLSNSLQVSLHISQGKFGSNASFSFMPPSCATLNYLLFLLTPTIQLEGPFQSSQCHGSLKIPVYNLSTDASYSAYVLAYNSSLSLRSSLYHFTTTEVSWATVLEGARHVMITCHFVPGSKAKGCFVQIRLVSTSPKVLYISRLPGSHFVTQCVHLPPNSPTKSFSIRDWKFDGSTGPLSVTTYIDVRQKPPCYVDLYSKWENIAHLALFCSSAAFMLGGTFILLIGLACRVAGSNKYLKRSQQSCRESNLILEIKE